MKRITLLFCLLTASLGFSQVVLEDFDGATAPTITVANGLAPEGATIIANTTGSGTAGNVLEIVSTAAGDPWQQANLIMQNNTMDLTTDTTVSVDVYSLTAINVLSRVEDQIFDPATPFATAESQHNGTGWETLTFDFTGSPDGNGGGTSPNGEYTLIAFFNNWVGNGAGNNTTNADWNDAIDGITLLVDNITAVAGQAIPETCSDGILNNGETEIDCGGPNCDACPDPPAEPTGPAPTPGVSNPAGYFSIYSDAYVDQSNVVFGAFDVGAQDITEIEIAPGDNILKVVTTAAPGQNFLFADWGTTVDVSNMTNYHMDYWIDTPFTAGLVMDHKFSNHVGDAGETSAFSATPGVSTLGQWVSIDIPISAMTNGDATQLRNALRQYVLTVAGADLDTRVVYLDNIYLYNASLSTDEFASADFKVYPNPTKNNWNIKSNTTISTVTVYDILGKQVTTLAPNASDVEISTANITSGIYFARIEGTNGSKTVKLIKE